MHVAVPLPTATGVYTLSGSGLFDFSSGALITSPVGTLDITAVPEPRTFISLFIIAVATLRLKLHKRLT
jgi:hypothetical protein